MIPLSQIEIKHTDGKELEFIHSGEDFVGFYIETNDGEFFSGTNNIILGKPLRPVIEDMNKNPQPTKRVLKFNLFKRKIKAFLSNTLPIPVMKQFPRESDYSNGYMIRYFAKRINHTTYFEIEKTTYDRIKNQDGTYTTADGRIISKEQGERYNNAVFAARDELNRMDRNPFTGTKDSPADSPAFTQPGGPAQPPATPPPGGDQPPGTPPQQPSPPFLPFPSTGIASIFDPRFMGPSFDPRMSAYARQGLGDRRFDQFYRNLEAFPRV